MGNPEILHKDAGSLLVIWPIAPLGNIVYNETDYKSIDNRKRGS